MKTYTGDQDITLDRDEITKLVGFMWGEVWMNGPFRCPDEILGTLEVGIVAIVGIEGQTPREAMAPVIPDSFPASWMEAEG
jgi:hypothetical protein